MTASSASPGLRDTYRFGPFKLSVSSHSLSQSDIPVRIQDLPFQMLLLLIERRGFVVSKDELRDRLWGDKTYVEVDQNLYVIVAKLRDLLGDDPVTPRYIKTVARRGYQFIGELAPEVTGSAEPQITPIASPFETPSPQAAKKLADDTSAATSAAPSARPATPWRTAATVGVVLAAVLGTSIAGFFLYRSFTHPAYRSGESILIGSGENEAGPSDFRPTLDFLIQLKLQESPFLSLIPDRRLEQFKRQASFTTQEDQLKACSALNGRLLIRSRLSARGSGLRVQLDAYSCPEGRHLATQWSDADSEASLLTAVDLVTEKMRRHLGEPDASLQRFNMPLTQSTTTSLAALRKFTEGETKSLSGDSQGAIPDYKLAIDLDPRFALAYARLGTIYLNTQEPTAAAQYMQKAFDLRDRTTDKEHLYITAHYYTDITGDLDRAAETYQLWASLYPRDWGPLNNLANLYDMLGKPDQGLEYARQAQQVNPDSTLSITTLAQAYLGHGDSSALADLCRQYGPKDTLAVFHNICFLNAVSVNDQAAMQHELTWARGNPEESLLLISAASAAAEHGHLQQAGQLFSEARTSALANKIPEMTLPIGVNEAIALAEFGHARQALALIRNLSQSPHSDVDPLATIILAIAGAESQALEQAQSAAHEAPANVVINRLELPLVQAIQALRANKPQQAVALLEPSQPISLYEPMKFAPAYYLGEAYLANKQYELAAKSFQRILDNHSISPDSIYVSLASLEKGRTLALKGDQQGATQAFTQTKLLWSDADPDFPPLKRLNEYQRQPTATPLN